MPEYVPWSGILGDRDKLHAEVAQLAERAPWPELPPVDTSLARPEVDFDEA